MAAINMLGFIAGTLGVGNFFIANFPGSGDQTQVRIAFGFADDCLFPCTDNYEDASGGLSMGAYDEHGDYAGSTYSAITTSGGESKNFELPDLTGANPAYVLLTGRPDTGGVCVSWVSTTGASGTQNAFMVGDWFNMCDVQDRFGSSRAEWFYGNVQGGALDDDTPWYPLCGWIDGQQRDGHVITEVAAEVASLQYSSEDDRDLDYLCHPPVMGWRATQNFDEKNELMEYLHPSKKRNAGFEKRAASTKPSNAESKPRPRDTRLVTSDISTHNATYLCAHPGSRGPDFVSLYEGVHCDMETRETAPLCGEGIKTDCFDLDEQAMVGKVAKRGLEKRYSRIERWEHEQLKKRSSN